MKHFILGLLATSVISFTACNSNPTSSSEENHQTAETSQSAGENHDHNHGDGGNFSELFSHYQHLVFALSSDNDQEAANAAKGMLESLPKIKTDGFNDSQKKSYSDISADIKENAEHISENVGKIDHQREHLVSLSKDFYDIKKLFGTDKTLYKVFCPMYNNNEGAYWLSDSKEVKNPYFGSQMLTCGQVQEELK